MSIDARERSTCSSFPVEGYWFSCGQDSWRYTPSDIPRILGGFEYTPETLLGSEIEIDQELKSGGITIELPLDNPVSQLFKTCLPPRPVNVVIYCGQDNDTEVGTAFVGMVSSVENADTCKMTLVTERDNLRRQIPGVNYQSPCVHQIFDEGCGLNRLNYGVIGTVASANGNLLIISGAESRPDGYFTGGWLETAHTAMSITSHSGSNISIMYALENLNIGDKVSLYPGCDGSESRCDIFGNILNHLGWCRIPSTNPFGEGGIR